VVVGVSDLRAITVKARVDATVKGTLYVTDEQVRQALEMAPDLPITDDDLVLYASEYDDLADVELTVTDVDYWRSSTYTRVKPA
jgi:hypothetical protein